MEPIFQKYARGLKKDGTPSQSYTILDMPSIMHETEQLIHEIGFKDLDERAKVFNYIEIMGYAGFMTGKQEDRPKLYITDKWPLKRKSDGVQFGYSVRTRSIGSGIESRFSVMNSVYDKTPFNKGDIICVKNYKREGQYFKLTNYTVYN